MMRLSRFRVQNYKVIHDTGEACVDVDDDVTTFVGQNESGKTAILRSLWKSRNVAGEKFDKLLDYPKARYSKDRNKDQLVTHIEFALTEGESKTVASLFPFGLDAEPQSITIRKSYKGENKVGESIAFEPGIEERCKHGIAEAEKTMQGVAKELKKHAGDGDTAISDAWETARNALDRKLPVWQEPNQTTLSSFEAAVDAWIGEAAERAPHADTQRKKLSVLIAEAQEGDPAAKARAWASANVPVFIYFSNYGTLETRIHLPTYIAQVAEETLSPRIRTQRALFTRSGIDPVEILELGLPKQPGEDENAVHRRIQKRRTLLESASFGLTGDWVDWWIPETQHRLHITADGEYLVLNVSDTKNPFQIPFEERSHGFQWFFSFYLVFLVESEGLHEEAILLLDEPGLHLHPTMQQKLVGFFDRVAEKNQVLYSTHLPFLVNGDRLERVRTVYLSKDELPNTIVSSDPCAGGDRDTLFPLQAALGYSIAQTLFLGESSVIVEGATDFMLMKALNTAFLALGEGTRLHEDVILVPAGGTKRLMPLASIMFSHTGVEGRRMLVLLDSDDAGITAGDRLKKELFAADDSGVLMLGSAIGLPDATIEDLLPRPDYAAAVGAALKHSVVSLDAAEMAEPTNATALSKHWTRMGWGKFGADEKVAAALWLVDAWSTHPQEIPLETRKRGAALFAAINRRFDI